MPRSVGYVGLGRRANSRTRSRRWQLAAEAGGGVGLFFRPISARRRARLGRVTIAGHTDGWNPGGNQTIEYRGSVSPGRQRRHRPGVGDRPCRGSCASGSRDGQFRGCDAQGPSLDRSEVVLFAGQNQRPLITVCSLDAERLGVRIGQPLAEARALLPKAVFLPADFVADRDALCQLALDCQRFTPLVGLEDGAHPESLFCEVTGCTHLWGGEAPVSRGRSRLLDQARVSDPARANLHDVCFMGARTHLKNLSRGCRRRRAGSIEASRGRTAAAVCRP